MLFCIYAILKLKVRLTLQPYFVLNKNCFFQKLETTTRHSITALHFYHHFAVLPEYCVHLPYLRHLVVVVYKPRVQRLDPVDHIRTSLPRRWRTTITRANIRITTPTINYGPTPSTQNYSSVLRPIQQLTIRSTVINHTRTRHYPSETTRIESRRISRQSPNCLTLDWLKIFPYKVDSLWFHVSSDAQRTTTKEQNDELLWSFTHAATTR